MTKVLKVAEKDPDEVLDFGFDWRAKTNAELLGESTCGKTDWLKSGEYISEATWTVDDGITCDADEIGGDVVAVWLSGGTAGEEYHISCTIVTTEARTAKRSMLISVVDRGA